MRFHLADFALCGVVVDDGLRQIVESLEAFLDRLLIVVDASARLCALQQSLLHRLVSHLPKSTSTITSNRIRIFNVTIITGVITESTEAYSRYVDS